MAWNYHLVQELTKGVPKTCLRESRKLCSVVSWWCICLFYAHVGGQTSKSLQDRQEAIHLGRLDGDSMIKVRFSDFPQLVILWDNHVPYGQSRWHRLRSTSIHEITLNSVTFTWEDNECHFHSCVSCTQILFVFCLDTFDTQKWLAPCNATLPVARVRAHGNGHRRVANGGALEAPRPIPGARKTDFQRPCGGWFVYENLQVGRLGWKNQKMPIDSDRLHVLRNKYIYIHVYVYIKISGTNRLGKVTYRNKSVP